MIDVIGVEDTKVIYKKLLDAITNEHPDYDISIGNPMNRLIYSIAQGIEEQQINLNQMALNLNFTTARGEHLDRIAATNFRGRANKPPRRNGRTDEEFRKDLKSAGCRNGSGTIPAYTAVIQDSCEAFKNAWVTSPAPSEVLITYPELDAAGIDHSALEHQALESISMIVAAGDRVTLSRAEAVKITPEVTLEVRYGYDYDSIVSSCEAMIKSYLEQNMFTDEIIDSSLLAAMCRQISGVKRAFVDIGHDEIFRGEKVYYKCMGVNVKWKH